MTAPRVCLGIDPSIAETGWAVVVAPNADGVWRPDNLVEWGTLRTKPSTPLQDRLMALAEGISSLTTFRQPALIALEEPAIAGLYAQHRGRQRTKATALNAADMRLLHMATAALVIGAKWGSRSGAELHFVKASRQDKRDRWTSIAGVLAGRRTNEHERDACALAVRALLDHRLRGAA